MTSQNIVFSSWDILCNVLLIPRNVQIKKSEIDWAYNMPN
jgi:hypothetical protein